MIYLIVSCVRRYWESWAKLSNPQPLLAFPSKDLLVHRFAWISSWHCKVFESWKRCMALKFTYLKSFDCILGRATWFIACITTHLAQACLCQGSVDRRAACFRVAVALLRFLWNSWRHLGHSKKYWALIRRLGLAKSWTWTADSQTSHQRRLWAHWFDSRWAVQFLSFIQGAQRMSDLAICLLHQLV